MAFDAEFTEGCAKYGVTGRNLTIADMSGEWSLLLNCFAVTVMDDMSGGSGKSLQCGFGGPATGIGTLTKTLTANYSRFVGGRRVKVILTTPAYGWTFRDGGTAQVSVTIEYPGRICVRRGEANGTLLATSTQALSDGDVIYLEWDVTIDGANGYAKIWLNGTVTSINIGPTNTRVTANNYANGFGPSGVINFANSFVRWQDQYDHFYVTGGTGGGVTPLLYNPVVETQFATADSAVDFTPEAGVLGQDYSATAGINAPGANQIALRKFTPVVNATINSVSILPAAAGGASAKCKGVIYSDSAGAPNALLSSGTEVVGLTSGTLATLPLVTPQNLTAGTAYWIGYITDTSIALSEVDTTITGAKAANTYASGAPGTAPGMTTGQPSWIIFGNCVTMAHNYAQVSPEFGNPALGNLSYNASANVSDADLFSFPALSVDAPIATVAVKIVAALSDAGARTVDMITDSAATVGTGSNPAQAPNTSYGWLSSYFKTDPNGAIVWTKTALDAATSGYDVAA